MAQSVLLRSRFLRRACQGAVAAGIAFLLVSAFGGIAGLPWLPCILIGGAYSVMMNSARGAYLDQAMTAGALGFPVWGLLLSFRSDRGMQFSAEAMRPSITAAKFGAFGLLKPPHVHAGEGRPGRPPGLPPPSR